MDNLRDLKKYIDELPDIDYKTPMLFIGHGNPMNAIEENEFSKNWNKIGSELIVPRAILCVSAHWETDGTFATAMERPRTIHDFYGFPNELFAVDYPAPGDPLLANAAKEIITKTDIELDNAWGLDHGTWSVLKHIYPAANIPVIQLSIDHNKTPQWHYELASELSVLRKKGILIIGSGNLVHNLRLVDWRNPNGVYDWAELMNSKFKVLIESGNHKDLINYRALGKEAMMAVPTSEHYIPLLYILGLKDENEQVIFFNDKTIMGSLSMTSLKIF